METLKSSLLLCTIVSTIISSCSSNTPVVSPIVTTIASPTGLPSATATFTFAPKPNHTPTFTLTNTPISTISTTRINLSSELYLDENSSPDNLGELNSPDRSNFYNDMGTGFIYHFKNEEWVIAQPMTRVIPLKNIDTTRHVEGELCQHYAQIWKDGKMIYSVPVGPGPQLHRFLRYEDHWIFSFGEDWNNQMQIVQDGILLNDLYDYDTAFSLFLLDGKPFFFFQRGDQIGISFHSEEIVLPYSSISYEMVCCEGGGSRNPRASDTKVGFYAKRGDSDHQYVEIGLR